MPMARTIKSTYPTMTLIPLLSRTRKRIFIFLLDYYKKQIISLAAGKFIFHIINYHYNLFGSRVKSHVRGEISQSLHRYAYSLPPSPDINTSGQSIIDKVKTP